MMVCGALLLQLAACGMVLYPERKGQKGGRIDPGVAILDGIGLLFFIIPGVIAFAVDFGTGAIYLPGTRTADAGQTGGMDVVRVDPAMLDEAYIEAVVSNHAGTPVDIAAPGVVMRELHSERELQPAMGSL